MLEIYKHFSRVKLCLVAKHCDRGRFADNHMLFRL